MKNIFFSLIFLLFAVSNQSVHSEELNDNNWDEPAVEIVTIKGTITDISVQMGYERGEHCVEIEVDEATRWLTWDDEDFYDAASWEIGDEVNISFRLGELNKHRVHNIDRGNSAEFSFNAGVKIPMES